MLLDILVQFSSFGDFHDDEDVVGAIQYLIQLDDVGMIDEFQYFYFSFDLRDGGGTLEIIFTFLIFSLLMILTATGRLVRSCLASNLAEISTFNLCKATLSQGFAQDVMPDMNLFAFNYVCPVHGELYIKSK